MIYVKATNNAGCADTKPLSVIVHPNPVITIKQPAAACIPETINLTDPSYTSGNDPNLKYTYWQDALARTPLSNPTKIAQTELVSRVSLGATEKQTVGLFGSICLRSHNLC